jgi:hypothetical protein
MALSVDDYSAAIASTIKAGKLLDADVSDVRSIPVLFQLLNAARNVSDNSQSTIENLNAFLNERGFPLAFEPQNPVSQCAVAEFLSSEVMAARIDCHQSGDGITKTVRDAADCLGLPTNTDLSDSFFQTVKAKVSPSSQEPLLTHSLSAGEWERFDSIAERVASEFNLRRNVLLTR